VIGVKMAKGEMLCGVLVLVASVWYCPARAQNDAINTYYNMTNGFLDVVQPTGQWRTQRGEGLGGFNPPH